MDPILHGMLLVYCVCIVIFAVKYISLHMTKSRLLQEELPFTVFATIYKPDDAEYIVRCVMDRVKWLDLHGMCRVVCLNPLEDPDVDAVLQRLVQIYPFAQIGSLQTRKNVL